MAKQHGDVARQPMVEARRPHPVAELEDAGKRPRRDAVSDSKTVQPARQQLVRKRLDGNRPPIRSDVAISLADLDRETRVCGIPCHSRLSRTGARRRFDTGT